MSFDEREVVPAAKSTFSMRAHERPRCARSRATPAPAMPPPTITASKASRSSPVSRPTGPAGEATGPRSLTAPRLGPRARARSSPSEPITWSGRQRAISGSAAR